MDLKRLFLVTLVLSVVVSAAIGIVVILIGNFGEFETKVLLTTLTITVTSILGLACGAYLETGRGRMLPSAGIVLAIVSAVMWIILIWQMRIENDTYIKSLMSATLFAASCSHISLLSLARLERKFIWSRYVAHIAIWALTAFLLYFIWTNGNIDEDLMGRVIGVLGIIIAALTVITPVFHKLSSSEPTIQEMDKEIAALRLKIVELETRRAELDPVNQRSDQ
ncbi:MAG: hypothetical protein AB7V18_16760 [Pyrinomonadaceae bacterium]